MGQIEHTPKEREWEQINERERYKIEALMRARVGKSEIARQLGRSRRTIQREIAQGTVTQMTSEYEYVQRYCADAGQREHNERAANKGRGLKIGHCHKLAEYLEEKIVKESYSPDAAIGRIGTEGMEFDVTICTKTVYNYIDAGVFANISNKDLPIKREKKKRQYRKTRIALNNTKGRSIEERPERIEYRETCGDWEMDCVESGKGSNACLLVLTERKSRKELLFKMQGKKQEHVKEVLDGLEMAYKERFRDVFRTITVDNGVEFLSMHDMERSVIDEDTPRTTIYYTHPYSAYERGSNENANKLIRRFIPKGSDIGCYTDIDIKRIEHWMNHYPRRLHGYKNAAEVYDEHMG